MAKISNTTVYPTITPTDDDLLILTDATASNKTKTVKLSGIKNYIGASADLEYETVAIMQAASLDVGKYAATLGYTTAGDGGGVLYLISASGSADGGSVIALDNGTYAIAQLNGTLDPVQWGAILNDASSATVNVTAMNAMFAYYSFHSTTSNSPFVCNFTSGQYYVDGTVFLPQPNALSQGGLGGFTFYFNNSTITPTVAATFPVLHRRLPEVNWTEPQDRVDASFAMYDLFIEGVGWGVGGVGLHVECTYNSIFSNINIASCETGLRLDFCLKAAISNSLYGANKRAIHLSNGTGLGWDTNPNENQCNRTKVDSVRVNMTNGLSTEGFYCEYAGGVELQTCVFEGGVPTNASVYVNMTGNTVVDFFAHNIHIESVLGGAAPAADTAVFKFVGYGRMYIDDVYPQLQGGGYPRTLVDASGFTQSSLISYSASWFDAGDLFRANSPSSNVTKWIFGGAVPDDVVTNAFNSTYWVGGDAPTRRVKFIEGMNGGTVGGIAASISWGATAETVSLNGVDAAGAAAAQITLSHQVKLSGGQIMLQPSTNVEVLLPTAANNIRFYNSAENIDARIMRPADGSGLSLIHLPTASTSYVAGITSGATPSGAGDTGAIGEIRTDATYMYVCTATDTWVRSALTAWP
jgi:hypothetical protein